MLASILNTDVLAIWLALAIVIFVSAKACQLWRRSAYARARRLLLSWLPPSERWSYRRNGLVMVTGNVTGNMYTVGPNVTRNDTLGLSVCFSTSSEVPAPDAILAKVIMLQCAEADVLEIANYFDNDYGTWKSLRFREERLREEQLRKQMRDQGE